MIFLTQNPNATLAVNDLLPVCLTDLTYLWAYRNHLTCVPS
jgi:hypothetical protein